MAEIKIEQKKAGWQWLIVGLVIVALLVYFLVLRENGKDTEEVTEENYIAYTSESDIIRGQKNDGNVTAFVDFVNSKKQMSLDHAYTNEALIKLTDAVNSKANEVGYEVRADIAKVKGYARMITVDPYETTHAGYIRKAVDILTAELHNIQKAKYSDLANEMKELTRASESINPEVLTLNQKDAIKNYFAAASDLLQKMN